jgi:hypothetical protein
MNRKLTAVVVGLGMLVMGMMVKRAHASYTDYLPANNTAQITVTIAPRVDRSVTISTDSPAGMLDMGMFDLGTNVSTQTVSPATVTVQGTIANTDLWLSAKIENTGGNTPWQFDTDSATEESDYIATWVSLTGTDVTSKPTQGVNGCFNGTTPGATSDLVDGSIQRIGNGAPLDGRFEDSVTSSNNFAAGTIRRHMWMYFRLPNGTSAADPEKITFILTVDAGL